MTYFAKNVTFLKITVFTVATYVINSCKYSSSVFSASFIWLQLIDTMAYKQGVCMYVYALYIQYAMLYRVVHCTHTVCKHLWYIYFG